MVVLVKSKSLVFEIELRVISVLVVVLESIKLDFVLDVVLEIGAIVFVLVVTKLVDVLGV